MANAPPTHHNPVYQQPQHYPASVQQQHIHTSQSHPAMFMSSPSVITPSFTSDHNPQQHFPQQQATIPPVASAPFLSSQANSVTYPGPMQTAQFSTHPSSAFTPTGAAANHNLVLQQQMPNNDPAAPMNVHNPRQNNRWFYIFVFIHKFKLKTNFHIKTQHNVSSLIFNKLG